MDISVMKANNHLKTSNEDNNSALKDKNNE